MKDSTFSKDPVSIDFNSSMTTESGRKAKLGDPATVHPEAARYVRAAHDAFVSGHATVTRLAEDETRMPVVKHDAARTVGLRTVAAIEGAQQSIMGLAKGFEEEAADAINQAFAPNPAQAFTYIEIAKWIGETAKAKDGIQRIRDEMENDPDIVTTLHNSKPYIMGLAKEVRLSLLDAGVEMHQPDAMRKIDEAAKLRKLADKYPRIAKGVRSSWWNNALADRARSRVEI